MGWLSRRREEKQEKVELVAPLPPFCVDCKWIRPDLFFEQGDGKRLTFAKCANPKSRINGPIFLVTGNPEHKDMHFCTTERGSRVAGDCGPSGRLFEPMYIDLEAVHVETSPGDFSEQNRIKILD